MTDHGTIQVGEFVELRIDDVGGNLHVSGGTNEEILYHGWHAQSITPQKENGVTIVEMGDIPGNCHLQVPHHTVLRICDVGGNARIDDVRDHVALEDVGGNLTLRKVGGAKVADVGGNLEAKKVEGNLIAEDIGGRAVLVDIEGNVADLNVGGNLILSNIGGPISCEAGGNIKIRQTPRSGQSYELQAGGNIEWLMPSNASVRLELSSDKEHIEIESFDQHGSKVYRQSELILTLGAGDASAMLEAGGRIRLYGQTQSSGGPASEFDSEFEASFDFGPFGEFARDGSFDFSASFGPMSEVLSAKVQEKIQRAIRLAEEKMTEAMRHAEQRIAHAEEMIQHHTQQWGAEQSRARHGSSRRDADGIRVYTAPPKPPNPTPPARPSVNDEERLMVLRMVEEGKISVDQAEKLLAAMGGEVT